MNEYIEGNYSTGFCSICGKDFAENDYNCVVLYKRYPESDAYSAIPVCRGFFYRTRCQIDAENKGYTLIQR